MKLEEIAVEITDEALHFFKERSSQNSSIIISYNEVMNWCGSSGEWLAVSISEKPQSDPESYFKINYQGIDLYFHVDAYFMVSGLPKLTIALLHSSYGDFLTIMEFDPQLS